MEIGQVSTCLKELEGRRRAHRLMEEDRRWMMDRHDSYLLTQVGKLFGIGECLEPTWTKGRGRRTRSSGLEPSAQSCVGIHDVNV